MTTMFAGLLLAIGLSETGPDPIDLFQANTDGYAIYRIPGIVATRKGTLLAYCEARKTSKSDWERIDLLTRRSTDGGKTWDPPRTLATPPADATKNPVATAQNLGKPGEITMNNPVAIADPTSDTVHVLYCVEYARAFYRRSDDDGATFSDPVEITATFDRFRPEYDWKVLATGPGHGTRLSNGRLVVPIWLSTGTGGHAHRPSAVATIVSDDGGKTWQRGDLVVNHPSPANPSETAAVELSDGRVLLNIRHESEPRLRGVVVGPDGATGWGPIRYDEALHDPVCFGSLAKLPALAGDGGGILFVNAHNPTDRKRQNLTVKLSRDDGQTWPISRTVDPGPSGYADLAVAPDGTIFCLYERSSGATSTLRLVRFDRKWLAGDGGTP